MGKNNIVLQRDVTLNVAAENILFRFSLHVVRCVIACCYQSINMWNC